MSPPPSAVPDVAAWSAAAVRKRFILHYQAASPSWQDRENAFQAMSDALIDAIQEVRAVNEAWQGRWEAAVVESERLREKSARLQAESVRFQARAAELMDGDGRATADPARDGVG